MEERQGSTRSPLSVFISYAHEDESWRQQLETHLSLLRRQGWIASWHDRKVMPGSIWAGEIDAHLEAAQIILLLISPDFLASDYCYDIEMPRALERDKQGKARVIPIIVRPVDWQDAPFAHLQCLPLDSLPVSEWEDRDVAFREITRAIRYAVEQVCGIPARKQPSPPSTVSRTHRQRLIKRIRTDWIKGVLEPSLYQAVLMTLGLHKQPDALINPWRLTIQEMNHPVRSLPEGTHIIQVYDEADGELLILGEPGAGKTTLLLELARDLLERAEEEPSHPVPAVFNLSLWVKERQPLVIWLAEELHTKYGLSREVATSWINNDQVIILLDGLDEVASESRSECVRAINMYQRVHDLVSIVVCSRSVEYFSLAKRLLLQQAVTIQPLTSEQIETCLSQMGEQVNMVRHILRDDLWLRELTTTPLMLSILISAFQGKSVEGLPVAVPLSPVQFGQATADLQAAYCRLLEVQQKTPEARQALIAVQTASEQLLVAGRFAARRRYLFATYTERMLHRRSPGAYTSKQTLHWLSWLAKTMTMNDQMVFSVTMPLKKLPHPPSRIDRFLSSLMYIGLSWPNLLIVLGGLSALGALGVRGELDVLVVLIVLGGLVALNGFFGLGLLILLGLQGSQAILRWYLYRAGARPWNYRRFLDFAAERILLHKVGNDYIFIHRLLLDYFASLETPSLKRRRQDQRRHDTPDGKM